MALIAELTTRIRAYETQMEAIEVRKSAQELRAIQDRIQSDITEYFAKLGVKAGGSVNRIVGAVLLDARIQDVRILSVSVGPDGVKGWLAGPGASDRARAHRGEIRRADQRVGGRSARRQ